MAAEHRRSPFDTSRLGRRTVGLGLLVGASVTIMLSGAFAQALVPRLRYERAAIVAGEWWRLFTAHGVHLDFLHGLLNAAALTLIVWLGVGRIRLIEWLAFSIGSIVATTAGLYWLSPEVGWYVGASGALHGLFAGAAVLLALRHWERLGVGMLVALTAKLGYEQLAHSASPWMVGSGFHVVTVAHLYGAVGGLTCALLILGVTAAGRSANQLSE